MNPCFRLKNETTHIEVRTLKRVIDVERSLAGFRDEISIHHDGDTGGLRQW